VRCLAGSRPVAEAVEARPTLEDAYLWLLRSSGSEILGARAEMEDMAGGDSDEQV